VVEPALVDLLRGDSRRLQQLQDVRGERGVAGGVVAQGAQLGIEAAEVVDRLVP
jgi:hypothetical protein